jgi:hypothetical protein
MCNNIELAHQPFERVNSPYQLVKYLPPLFYLRFSNSFRFQKPTFATNNF